MPRAVFAPLTGAEHQLVPDLLEVHLPAGGRVVVMSDLHLGQQATASSEQTVAELGRALDSWAGPGLVVLAGDVFELLAESTLDPGRALAAHPRFGAAMQAFAAAPDRRVIALPGNHDGALAWNPGATRTLNHLGIEVALSVEVVADTGGGARRIRVEHGHQHDPANAFDDPRNPAETPIGHHVVRDLLPIAKRPGAEWLSGINLLSDPAEAGAFVASRLLYRRVSRRLSWLLVPFALGLLVLGAQIGARIAGHPSTAAHLRPYAAASLGVGIVLVLALVGTTLWWASALRKPLAIFAASDVAGGAEPSNDGPRSAARSLVGKGYAGLITGHTHQPELVDLGDGFYANTGCGGSVVERRPGRVGLPAAFGLGRHLSWLEIEAGSDLHVRLHYARQDLPTTSALERIATRPVSGGSSRPEVVASWPSGGGWPPVVDEGLRQRRARRWGATAIAVAAMVDLASAVTPPFRRTLRSLSNVVPLAVSQTATVLVALIGVALLLLARGVRRGQRHAWAVAVLLVASSAVLHLVKGLNVVEGVFAALITVYLLANRRFFLVKEDEGATRRALSTLLVGAVVALGAATAAIEAFPGKGQHRLPLGQALHAAAERMVGLETIELPLRFDQFLTPAMLAIAVGLAVAAGWSIFQPVRASRLSARPPEAEEQARRLVEQYGGDTLSYFALRDDKRWFFFGDTLVAYAVHQGVCLVSPDPIGPLVERREAWTAFRRFADDHGWPVAVMGASEGWLPIYRAAGMRDLYVGDEAVVDVRRFSLEGGRNKGLRQAVNRIAKYGYRIEFHDPAHLSPELQAGLRALMDESRRGEVERGFSMTLSRVFNPKDEGLLLAVCFGPDDTPVAFCHYVPATAINGYSLDLMRRSEGEHPNGLTDFAVVRTIEHLRANGKVGLGLNFAVMRSVLAGERGDRLSTRVQKWFLLKMSDSMQIESLWKFNAKFDPDWVPRYAVYDSAEHLVSSAVAVARAESFWELPVIGRFFKPKVPGGPEGHPLPALPDHRGAASSEPEPSEPDVADGTASAATVSDQSSRDQSASEQPAGERSATGARLTEPEATSPASPPVPGAAASSGTEGVPAHATEEGAPHGATSDWSDGDRKVPGEELAGEVPGRR